MNSMGFCTGRYHAWAVGSMDIRIHPQSSVEVQAATIIIPVLGHLNSCDCCDSCAAGTGGGGGGGGIAAILAITMAMLLLMVSS